MYVYIDRQKVLERVRERERECEREREREREKEADRHAFLKTYRISHHGVRNPSPARACYLEH